MTPIGKAVRAGIIVFGLVLTAAVLFYLGRGFLSLPFRETNDLLHEQGSPVTLDFLIPGGTYIEKNMTVGRVMQLRWQAPGKGLASALAALSEKIPVRYRSLATGVFYLFWTFLLFVFFRVATWMRYMTALGVAMFGGAVIYYFMPDLMFGRIDDVLFLGWSCMVLAALRWYRKKAKAKRS